MKSILLYQEGKATIAAWMEKDLLAQGPSREIALRRLYRTILSQAVWDLQDGNEPFAKLPCVPEIYQIMYARALPTHVPLPTGCEDWVLRFSSEGSPFRWVSEGKYLRVAPKRCIGSPMSTADTAADERISFWKDFRKVSLQQFNRSNASPARDVLFVLDPNDDFAIHLARVTYRAAIKEPNADPSPNEELGTLAIIGAPYVLILPLDAARSAMSTLFPKAMATLATPPEPGKVRVAILQDVGTGPGCTVITDDLLKSKRSTN